MEFDEANCSQETRQTSQVPLEPNEKKGATGCVGDLLGIKNYPIIWGLFHKPLFFNPYWTIRIQWKVRVFFVCFLDPRFCSRKVLGPGREEWGGTKKDSKLGVGSFQVTSAIQKVIIVRNPRLKWKLGKGDFEFAQIRCQKPRLHGALRTIIKQGSEKKHSKDTSCFLFMMNPGHKRCEFIQNAHSVLFASWKKWQNTTFFFPGTFRLVAIWITSPRYVICQCTRYFWRWYAIDISQVCCVVFFWLWDIDI